MPVHASIHLDLRLEKAFMKLSNIETLAVRVLRESGMALTVGEIAKGITSINPDVLRGKTPTNSLYSVLYRKEKQRESAGEKALFVKFKKSSVLFYELNAEKSIKINKNDEL